MKTGNMQSGSLRAVRHSVTNNVTRTEGISSDIPQDIAQAAFVGGASEMAKMFREVIKNKDHEALAGLIKATETKSFYGLKD